MKKLAPFKDRSTRDEEVFVYKKRRKRPSAMVCRAAEHEGRRKPAFFSREPLLIKEQSISDEMIFVDEKEEASSEGVKEVASNEGKTSSHGEEDGDNDHRHAIGLVMDSGQQSFSGTCDALIAITAELVASLQGATFMPPVSCV